MAMVLPDKRPATEPLVSPLTSAESLGWRGRFGAGIPDHAWFAHHGLYPAVQMYAWSVASAQLKSGPLDYQLKEALMLQPPFDMGLDRVR